MSARDKKARDILEHGPVQDLSGAGAIDLNAVKTRFTSTGAGQALTLADGRREGHEVFIEHIVDGGAGVGSGVLTAGAALHLQNGIASITLVNAKDWIRLRWTNKAGTKAWELWGYGGGVTFT